MTDRPLRLRFAPSPTGYFHVGGARTALYNRILATQHGGTLILRIEDTDAERNRPEWTQGILDALRWIGADWDEGPYFQSERAPLHRDAAARLYADGAAYYCDCTREQVDARTKGNATPGYDGYCRDRGLGPGPGGPCGSVRPTRAAPSSSTSSAARRRSRTASSRTSSSSGATAVPMFILANVVDDMDLKVSHVVRGEEHLPNTPKAQLLWAALGGGEPPVWAHVPVLVNEKRQKLSKRRDKVALESYRDEGYLDDAMRNYLLTLGLGAARRSGDRAVGGHPRHVPPRGRQLGAGVLRREEARSSFNDEYVRALPLDDFIAACQPWLAAPAAPWPPEQFDAAVFERLAPLVQERAKVLSTVPSYVDFIFLDRHPRRSGVVGQGHGRRRRRTPRRRDRRVRGARRLVGARAEGGRWRPSARHAA